jgi:signal transduction histidine kinase
MRGDPSGSSVLCVGTRDWLMSRARAFDLLVIDWVLAVLLTVGVLADAALLSHHPLSALAIAACMVSTVSVAWRRRYPALATLIAVTAQFGLLGVGQREVLNGAAVAIADAAVMLDFYLLGRQATGRRGLLVAGALLAYALVMFAVISGSASVSDVLLEWVPFVALFAVARTLATRRALTRELAATAARLKEEQELRARRAASEERNRMARELHDVIAHCVSVMVVQTSAARRVLRLDVEAAREAMQAVEGSGREALVELRRIVGVLRHGSDELAGFPSRGLSELDALVDRARAAGLPVELRVEGRRGALPPDLGRVAYRFVQEALTNAIKHAGGARTQVTVSIGARELELAVSDTGLGPAPAGEDRDGSGHGLVGMRERVTLYGGELRAGPGRDGGFEVRARIPLVETTSLPRAAAVADFDPVAVPATGELRWAWLDPAFAAVVLVALEVEASTSSYRRGPLVLNMIAIGVIALAATMRRRRPLLFLIVSGVMVDLLSSGLTSLHSHTLAGTYTVLVLPYTVAAWENRPRAAAGLAVWVSGAVLDGIVCHAVLGDFVGATATGIVVWAVGRAIRSRRMLIEQLQRTSAQLAAERAHRERLAVAGERSRIARELHAVVAGNVAAMVVQAEATQRVLRPDQARADATMGAIEDTGRQALSEMRRILGVLRHTGDAGEREPQPGVDQIYVLIERARDRGQVIELSVDGEPGTLPAGVNLGLYRLLEDALQAVRQQPATGVGVALRFGEDELELHLTRRGDGPSLWPTAAMRERVALCGGEVDADGGAQGHWQFVARMPRGAQGALA